MRFKDILDHIKNISNVTAQDNLIKEGIRMGLERATAKNLPYLMTDGYITTVAPYTTGTAAVTNNSKTVTGTGTIWTSAMVGRKIRFSNENAYYRISAFVSATEITLETVYQGTTQTAATYSLYKDEYRLAPDCDTYKILRQIENARSLVSLEPSAFDILEPAPESEGSPIYDILIGTKLDTYTTGTVSGTISTYVITGSGTSWASVEGLSKGSQITVGDYVYTVKSVDSNTQITTYEILVAAISAGTSYSILLDNLILQLFYIPDSIENIYYRYQRLPYPLVRDSDIPDLPNKYHWILVHAGLIWAWLTKDKERSDTEQLIFEGALGQMWARIGYPSSSLVHPRRSQDEIMIRRNLIGPRLPEGYGYPFSI